MCWHRIITRRGSYLYSKSLADHLDSYFKSFNIIAKRKDILGAYIQVRV